MGENVKKQKKSGSINAFVIVFLVIVGCYIMSLFISPGAFDREVLNGRTVVIANSFHATEKTYLGPQAIFQSLSQESDPWRAGPALTPEEGGSTFIL